MAIGNERELLTEPVTRLDGEIIRLTQAGRYIVLEQSTDPEFHGATASCYTDSEVERLGEGDFQLGLARIEQAAFLETDINMRYGPKRFLNDELKRR